VELSQGQGRELRATPELPSGLPVRWTRVLPVLRIDPLVRRVQARWLEALCLQER
jgi:hypothetical protein